MRNLNSVHLNGLRAVETVARTGSLQAAAEELGVSASAVSQQVNRTEKQIGKALFRRTSRGLAPTEAGAAFFARLSAGFRELDAAVGQARQAHADTLVVSVAPAFATKWLVPRLRQHFARHPTVLVRVDATERLVDLGGSDVDVAIRMGDGRWPGVEAELLLPQQVFVVAAAAKAGRIRTVADLARETSIDDDSSRMVTWERFFEAAGIAPVRPLQGARFNDPLLCLDTVIAGQGITLAWQLICADALSDGRLAAPLPIRADLGFGFWICTAAGTRPSRKVRDFIAWIRAEMAQTAALHARLPAG
jgi:LysR family transcriptional regulator, glycine cleavage system transcriptional activator